MAYSALPSKSAGDTITLTNYDAIKDNFAAGVPDIFTTKGDLAAASAADTAVRLAIGADDATLVPDASQTSGLAWQIQPAARVYNDADEDAGTATWTTLTFNSERYDTDTVHSTSSNTGRLTVPTGGGGLYHIGACAEFETGISANAVSVVGLRILLNGTTVIAADLRDTYRAEANNLIVNLSCDYALVATDYVEVQAYTEQDVNVAASGNYSPEFWMSWQRRA